MTAAREDQRAFLNRYYGVSRYFYDATRKYYLFGRDEALRELAADWRWTRLLEIGPGTGRNLARIHDLRPDATLGGVEASDAMLEHARKRCPWARLEHGFAEDAPLAELLSGPPERILFSYCLSMVEERQKALEHTRAALAPGGEVVVVDFADFAGLPEGFSKYSDVSRRVPRAPSRRIDACGGNVDPLWAEALLRRGSFRANRVTRVHANPLGSGLIEAPASLPRAPLRGQARPRARSAARLRDREHKRAVPFAPQRPSSPSRRDLG